MKRTFGLLLALMTLTLASSSCSFFRSAGMQSRRHVLPDQRISIEEVYSSRDHLGIYGRLYRPVGVKGRLPLVILSHGFGVTHRDGEGYAELLTRMGYLCYTFDFNGGGRESLSAGATTDMSVLTEQADLNAVIDQLKRRSDVDPRHITLLGFSQGGLVSALTAASRPDDIASLILIYPAFSIPEMARKQWGEYSKIPQVNTFWGMRLGEKYYKDVWNIDPYAVIGRFQGPVLILHGDKDRIVEQSVSDRAATIYKNAEYHVIPGGEHGFSGEALQQVKRYIQTFMKR